MQYDHRVGVRASVVLGLLALTMIAFTATSALADYPMAEDFGVACVPADPEAGDDTSCEVVGAVPGEGLMATADISGVDFFEESGRADADGGYAFGFSVPDDANNDVVVRVTGADSGEVATAVLTVTTTMTGGGQRISPVPAGTLPLTGTQVASVALLGFTLIAGGLLLVRRREDVARLT